MSDLERRCPDARVSIVELERGRECYGRRAWAEAYRSLSSADQASPLAGEDLELLAMAAYLIGRDDDYLRALDRAHQAYLDAGDGLRAVRCSSRALSSCPTRPTCASSNLKPNAPRKGMSGLAD